ncbi:secreted protein [marine sediment metagenome]|uniref:Secreted protein n=1 Tax=marine sediment metagenome TaxID=412755 RepID=A0A1B6NT63_9ZZZZ
MIVNNLIASVVAFALLLNAHYAHALAQGADAKKCRGGSEKKFLKDALKERHMSQLSLRIKLTWRMLSLV